MASARALHTPVPPDSESGTSGVGPAAPAVNTTAGAQSGVGVGSVGQALEASTLESPQRRLQGERQQEAQQAQAQQAQSPAQGTQATGTAEQHRVNGQWVQPNPAPQDPQRRVQTGTPQPGAEQEQSSTLQLFGRGDTQEALTSVCACERARVCVCVCAVAVPGACARARARP